MIGSIRKKNNTKILLNGIRTITAAWQADVCMSNITFMGVKVALASVYITPGSSQKDH